MAFSGFGKQTGPTGPPPPKFANPFNQFTRPPSPSRSPSPLIPSTPSTSFSPIRSPRRPEYSQVLQSPSLSLKGTIPSSDPPQPSYDVQRPYESSYKPANGQRPMARNFVVETNQRPVATSLIASHSTGTSFSAKIARYPDARPLQSTQVEPLRNSGRNFVSSHLDFRARTIVDYSDTFLAENYHPLQNEGHRRIRSSPIEVENVASQRNSNSLVGNCQVLVSRATQSPPLDLDNRRSPLEVHHSREAQRPTLTAFRSPQRLPGNSDFSIAHQNQSSVSPHVGSYGDKSSSPVKLAGRGEEQKRISSSSPAVKSVFQGNSQVKDMSISPPAVCTKSDDISWPDLGVHQNALSANGGGSETSLNKAGVFPVPKRTRSPSSLSMDQDSKRNSYSSHNEEEREMQAKAKRLARFKIELSEPVKDGSNFTDPKVSYSKQEPSMMEGVSSQRSVNLPQDFPVGDILPDNEGPEPSNIIIGLCPDMCPESERAERERKGDLDQYERLDGDRNQTNKSLAVKKYNRTAEREAILIRPMPVLQKTILYLLNLLDQPYDERFLGIYNFLWDRMRAVRMDLRMQHIFNLESVKMLEQMIRLHIIAMHELCEYEKGEGFSEGFDAHLNIEQMNKASAELFQLYDDHRKKGINVPTEKEFRGYYALLKLDKHPGYKVEPAELSLDLAKMTPEIRQTPEVRFARDVARACRTGNFIAFFRLARKASYLQACLMHAHFAKLRSQALASLHSGLQSNQGLPVAVIARWLAIEEEDIESLLEYHGFTVREYEEPYLVKEGPFLHGDSDYPTKCSKLVNGKRSAMIVEDVLPSKMEAAKPALEARTPKLEKGIAQFAESGSPVDVVEEEMLDSGAFSSPKESNPRHLMLEITGGLQHKDHDHKMDSSSPKASSFVAGNSPQNFSVAHSFPRAPRTNTIALQHKDVDHKISGVTGSPWNVKAFQIYNIEPQHEDADHIISGVRSSPWKNIISSPSGTPHKNLVTTPELKSPETTTSSRIEMKPLPVSRESPVDTVPNDTEHAFKKEMPLDEAKNNLAEENLLDYHQANKIDEVLLEDEDEELAEAKLKLIIRLWKRRASRLRELRDQRQLAAASALNALSLGPQIGCNKELSSSSDTFDIDQVMRERYEKCEQSWSRLNVADTAADVLIQKNPNARCLCWKVVFCSTMITQRVEELGPSSHVTDFTAARWLHAKLMPVQAQDDNLVLSSPGLSIWRKWVSGHIGADLTCLLSVMKDTSDNFNEAVHGASALLLLLSESIPFEHQKIQLHKLLAALPSEACLPLLILSDSNKGDMLETSSIINNLGLHGFDRSRLCGFSVIYLVDRLMDSHEGFFSDQRLQEGLQWLARESPPQPVLHCVHTRELVRSHLSMCLEIRGKGTSGLGPEHCILAFNKALEQTLEQIAVAAKSNPTCWPCSEIALLDESSSEYRIAHAYLPSIGWSTEAKIRPILSAFRKSKLPEITDEFSWLKKGSKMGIEVESQRQQLVEYLVRYLSETSNTLGYSLARNEASVMLQKYVRLVLHDSTYFIIPNWEMIFQRIFNWRLMNLSGEEVSQSYILEQHVTSQPLVQDYMNNETDTSMNQNLMNPSLDELLEVSRDLPSTAACSAHPELVKNSARTAENGGVRVSDFSSINEITSTSGRNFPQNGDAAERNDVSSPNTNSIISSGAPDIQIQANDGSDKLSRLLEQCNKVQNIIEEKLAVYF